MRFTSATLKKYRATFSGLDNSKQTAFDDEVKIHAESWEEATRIAEAFAFGRRRDDRVEAFDLISIKLDTSSI